MPDRLTDAELAAFASALDEILARLASEQEPLGEVFTAALDGLAHDEDTA